MEGGPYGGSAAIIPGIIEAEEYDTGGQGVAYSDTTTGNSGGVRGYCYGRFNNEGGKPRGLEPMIDILLRLGLGDHGVG